jgi:hypothetical protein
MAAMRVRRGPGAVGNGRIVAYRARSPARSAAEGHARTTLFQLLFQKTRIHMDF